MYKRLPDLTIEIETSTIELIMEDLTGKIISKGSSADIIDKTDGTIQKYIII